MRVLIAIGILMSLWACETLVNDVNPNRLPTTKNSLVVHGFLAPQDTAIVINVQVSNEVLGRFDNLVDRQLASIPDAKVWLTNRGRTVEIPFDTRRQQYALHTRNMTIRSGDTYDLKVTWKEQTVESSCRIPRAILISDINRDSVLVNETVVPPAYDLTFRVFWSDTGNERNYYRILGMATLMERVETAPNVFTLRPTVFNVSFGNFSSIWVTDEGNDGSFMISDAGKIPYSYRVRPNAVPTTRRVEFSLISYEKTYYDYHQAVQKFEANNPFAEPSLIPSNIKGGLGCFAGYTRSTRVGSW